ncbi:MAG TPA: hypothetical protein VLR49_10210, partial [Ferruginibacter sp.]|nr:hypothetical protein [Ferruginibacter sp.]
MSEVNTPRLMAAAKEFNIGTHTLIDFLVSKNFNGDELKPTTKLSEEMYRVLQGEFQQDKVAKQKAELIDLPKGAAGDAKKKKDEEDLSIKKKEEKARQKVEEKPAAEVVVPVPEEKPAVEVIVPVVEEKPVIVEKPVIEEKPAEPKPVVEVKLEEKAEEKEIVKQEEVTSITKIEAPELEGPKVLDKIDLDA